MLTVSAQVALLMSIKIILPKCCVKMYNGYTCLVNNWVQTLWNPIEYKNVLPYGMEISVYWAACAAIHVEFVFLSLCVYHLTVSVDHWEVVLSVLPARLRIDDTQAYIHMYCERGNPVSALGVGGNRLRKKKL